MKNQGFLMAMGCTVAVGLLVVCSANAAVVAESGFNNSSGIMDPTPLTTLPAELDGQGGTGLGWTLPWTNYQPGVFADYTADVQDTTVIEGDQAVYSTGGSGGTGEWSTYGRAFTPQSTGKVLFEFSVRFEALGPHYIQPCEIWLSDFGVPGDLNPANYVGTPARFGVGLHGDILQDGNGTKWENYTLQPATWYRIGALLDMDLQTYQVSLDDIEGTVFDGSYDVARPFGSTSGTQITSFFWANQHHTTYFDEFRISTPADIPGDADTDGDVDADDAQALATHWGSGSELDPATWEEGNFNGDYVVGPADAAILAANWGYPNNEANGATTVPEPSTAVLLLGLTLALMWRRRK